MLHIPVVSRHFAGYGYDCLREAFEVVSRDFEVSRYEKVPIAVYQKLASPQSLHAFVTADLDGHFQKSVSVLEA